MGAGGFDNGGRDVRKFVNLDTRKLQDSTGFASGDAEIRVCRKDGSLIELGFCRSGNSATQTTLDLGAGVTPDARLIVKKKTGDQRFDETFTFRCLVFTRTVGDDGNIYYAGHVSIDAPAIDTALGVDAGVSAVDQDEVELSAQISVLVDGERQTCRKFPFWIENNYDRDEADPAPTSSSRVRAGSVAIPSGQNYVDVAFATDMPDANWVLRNHVVRNTVDAAALNLWPGVIKTKTASGYRVLLNGDTDSVNYHLDYICDQS